jgi:hypothetical protein
MKIRDTFRRSVIVLVAVLWVTVQSQAQDTPLISGGIGFLTATKGGNTSYFPTAQPLIAFPLGSNLLVEGRAALLEDFSPEGNGQADYSHFHYVALSYLQLDYIATAHATVVGGEFLTPFGTYNERLTPIWISNFEDAPLILSLGNGTGSSVGGMVRGSALSNSRYSIDYAAYYSAASSNQNFSSHNGWGGRASVYLPAKRLEVGTSYTRATEDKHVNDFGLHVWWEPSNSPFKLRSEFAHGAHAQGYWLESDYRLSRFGGDTTLLGRLEPVFRWQQTFRSSPSSQDGLPSANTQRADFGMDYHLPHELRINTSYSRQLSSSGNSNIWETGIIYRFLTPTWRGK